MKQLHDQHQPMTFYPSYEELASFEAYVAYMESQGAHKAGIAKIVPPKGWVARKAGYDPTKIDMKIGTPVSQVVSTTPTALGAFTTRTEHTSLSLTLTDYYELATSGKHLPPRYNSHDELERLYWQQVAEDLPATPVKAEVQGTLIDTEQAVFNMARLPNILSELHEETSEVCRPRLSVGMWKTTTSWQVEDMDLFAVKFLHCGAPKTYYSVPPESGYKLEQVVQKLFPDVTRNCFNLLRHKNIMVSPKILLANNVPVNKVVHEQGTFLIFFPHAYYSGFDHGFNMAEGVNFALPRWVEYGKRFRDCLCGNKRMTVKLEMDKYVEKFQPDKFSCWQDSEDFALHPEDPVFVKRYWVDLKTRLRLGFISNKEFEMLMKSLRLKREVAGWFRLKFPNLDYSDSYQLVKNEGSEYTPVKKMRKISPVDGSLDKLASTLNKEFKAIEKKHRGQNEVVKSKKTVGVGRKEVSDKGGKEKSRKSLFKCPSNKKHKLIGCRKCPGCKQADCDACVYCLDKPRNGGKLVLKQKCKKRVCDNPVMGTCALCKSEV